VQRTSSGTARRPVTPALLMRRPSLGANGGSDTPETYSEDGRARPSASTLLHVRTCRRAYVGGGVLQRADVNLGGAEASSLCGGHPAPGRRTCFVVFGGRPFAAGADAVAGEFPPAPADA
jgi:hypothetical protein